MSKRQRFPEAEPLLRESLAMTRKLYDDNHPKVAASMGQLATMRTKQTRYDAAEPIPHPALAIPTANLKPGHTHIARTTNNHATMYSETATYWWAATPD